MPTAGHEGSAFAATKGVLHTTRCPWRDDINLEAAKALELLTERVM